MAGFKTFAIIYFKVILPYTSGMKNREERSKHFFDSAPLMEEDEGIALHDRVRRISIGDVMIY